MSALPSRSNVALNQGLRLRRESLALAWQVEPSRFQKLANPFAQEGVGVLYSSCPFHVGCIGQQRDPVRNEACFSPHGDETAEGIAFLTILQQTFPKVAQAGGIKASVIQW